MKKKFLLFTKRPSLLVLTCFIHLFFLGQSQAQKIRNYGGMPDGAFTAASGTFTSISSTGTSVNFISNDDGTAGPVPLGFTFVYMGVPYTTCYVNTNGYISFSPIAPGAGNTYGPLDDVLATNFHPAICAYLLDLEGATANGYFETTGSPGSRVFTYELKNWGIYPYTYPPSFSLQIKLYEGTGMIEFVYDNLAGTQEDYASIGLTSSSSEYLGIDYPNSKAMADTFANYVYAPGKPASGQIYRFEPPTSVGAKMAFGSFTSVKTNALTFDWAHYIPDFTIGYLIEISKDYGSTYSTLGSCFTTSYTATGLTPGSDYMFRITPITEGFVGTSLTIESSSQSTEKCSPFSGTLEIGPSGNFSSIKSAIDSLNNVGFSGDLILELQGKYSSSGEVFPITIPDFRNRNCNNSDAKLTIRPVSGASNLVISGSASSLFILDNAYKFTIDGRPGGSGTTNQLQLSNTSGTVFTLQNDAIGNTIQNCNIMAGNTASASGAIFIGGTNKLYGNDSNMISNNIITKVSGYTLATGITSTGVANIILQNDNNSILNNEIHSFTTFGVNITASVGNGSNWNISGNSFYATATTTSTTITAINLIPGLASNSNGNIITGNYIGGTAAKAGGSAWTNSSAVTFNGIIITCHPGTVNTVQNNTIQNISLTNTTSTSPFNGINITGGAIIIGGASGKGNIIGHPSNAKIGISSLGNNVLVGISSSSPNEINISHNTVANINQDNATGTTAAVRGIVNTSGSMVFITNNIIKSLSTNSSNAGSLNASSVGGIFVSSAANIQYITDNTIGGGPSEALSSTNTTALVRVTGMVNLSGISMIKRNKINGLTTSAPSTSNTTSAAIIGMYHQGNNGCVYDSNEIRNVSATAATTTQTIGMYIATGATEIRNNILSGFTTASTTTGSSTTAALSGIIYNTAVTAIVDNNTIENFAAPANAGHQIIGIYLGSALTYARNNTVRNFSTNSSSTGTTTTASIIGISTAAGTANKIITGNKIHNLNNNHATAVTMITGIYFTTSAGTGNNSIVSNNFIHSFKLATSGIGLLAGINNTAGIATFNNNMIRLGIDSTGATLSGPYNIRGIVHASSSSSNYYNNSIYLAGTSAGTTNTACIDFSTTITVTETVNVKNNIFYNNIKNSSTGRNAAIRMSANNGRIFSNNNILYAPNTGGAAGIINTTAYTALTGAGNWNATALVDGQSILADPSYKTPDGTFATVDLHLNTSNPVESAGDLLVTSVTDDFDGQVRSGLTPGDIGADADNFKSTGDKTSPFISFTPINNTFSTSNPTVVAVITDNSTLPFTTANTPRIYFKKGSGTYFSVAGTLASGNRKNGIWNFTIDGSTMGGVAANDIISYFIIAQDSAGNVGSNAMYAIATNVNTITTAPVTPNTYSIMAALATTIDVGTGQTYTSLTATGAAGLFNAINTSGLKGNTIINITSDLTETGAVGLNQWYETGGSNYTLTIRPSAAARRTVSGTASPTGGLIRLNGADRVRITGIPSGGSSTDTFLFIKSTGVSVPAIALMSDAVDNLLENCVVESSASGTTSGAIQISPVALVTGNDNNAIKKCYIRSVSGASLAVGIYAAGITPTVLIPIILNDNITISDCHIYNWVSNGISVSSIGNGNNWNILNNNFYRTLPTAAAGIQVAINFVPGISSNNNTISGNYIGGMAANAGGKPLENTTTSSGSVGILVNAGIEGVTSIQNNTIRNLLFSQTTMAIAVSSPIFIGINVTGGIADVGGTTGNIIGDAGTANSIQTNSDASVVGINSSTAFKLTVNNNTVANLTALGSTTFSNTAVRGIAISSGTGDLNVNNNLIKGLTANSTTTGSSTAAAVFGIGINSSGLVQNMLNNNVQNLKNLNSTAAHCMVGIYTVGGGLITVKGNVISGLISSTTNANVNAATTGIMGMLMQSNLGGSEFSNNTITDLQYTSASPVAVQMIGLLVNTGSNLKITGNTISSLRSVSTSAGTTSSSAIIGLSYSGAGTFITIEKNTIHSLHHTNTSTSAAVNVIGLYNTGATFATSAVTLNRVSRNFVHSLKLSTNGAGSIYGIYNFSGFLIVENNMVRMGIDSAGNNFSGPYNVHGIFQSFANGNCFYFHNSVFTCGSPASGSAITSAFSISAAYTTLSTRAVIKNNIFVNSVSNTKSATGKNYGIKLSTSDLILSNNNLIYVNGTGGYVGGTTVDYVNLSGTGSWQSATNLDMNSGSSDPNFVDATGSALSVNLRLSSSNPAEGNGTIDVPTTLDFDGNTRASRSPADIGANSGNFKLSADIIAPSISFSPLSNTGILTGSRSLTNVTITDNIGIPMTGGTIPRIYFSKDGNTWYSSAAKSLTGTSQNAIASFEITYSTMGGVSVGDAIRYYIIAQDNAGNIMSNNTYALATNVNSITTHPDLPNTYWLLNTIAGGTKLRVGTGKTYPSLTGIGGLFEYLNTVSLGGNITAVICSDTEEPGLVALNQLGDNGSDMYSLTIRPDSLTSTERLLFGMVPFSMIRIDGADRIKITGIPDFNGKSTDKKLRFRNSSTSGQTILFLNEASDNRLNNLNIEGGNTSLVAGLAGVVLIGPSNSAKGNSRDSITNCIVGHDQTGSLPLGVPGVDIHSYGDFNKENSSNVITGNEITNFIQFGVWVSNVGTGSNLSISGNSFYRSLPFPAYAQQQSIAFDPSIFSGNHTISNNYIGGSAKNCGGSPWENNGNGSFRGISCTFSSLDVPSNISNNVIQNINLTNIGTASQLIGIAIISGGMFNITNNLIGHPTNINSIRVAGNLGHIGILTQSNSVCNIRGNAIQGINITTGAVPSSFIGISLLNGFASATNNIVGSQTISNSIQYAGAGSIAGIQSTVTNATSQSVTIDSNIVANISGSGTEANNQVRGIINQGTAIASISNNKVFNLSSMSTNTSLAPPTAAIAGIFYSGASLGGKISNNTVYNIKAANTGNFATNATGIGITGGINLMVSNNRILDISNLSSNTSIVAPATIAGINIAGPQSNITLQNNQVALGIGQTNSPLLIGIWQSVSGNFTINSYYNSVYIGGTASSGISSSFGFLRGNNFSTTTFNTSINLKNNILINDRKGGTGKHYSIGNQSASTTFQTGWLNNASNYNFFANSSSYPVGLWNISDYNFNDWKSNSSSDLNSIYMATGTSTGQINPANLFQNIATGNLSLIKTNAEALNIIGKATPITGITTDYDNLTRNSSTPTIGSSEAYLNDVGVSSITSINNTCGKPVTTITVILKNYGLQSQSNIPVKLVGTGAGSINLTETVSGPIAPNATVSYTFTGTFNSVLGGVYNFKSYTNLSGDGVRTNDTSSLTMSVYPLPKPSFSYTDTCFGNSTKFTSTSTVTVGTVTANSWKFGDGGTGTGNTINHAYATAGTAYNVKIISTSSNGCIDSSNKSIFILSNLAGGVIATNQSICYNTTPSLITNTTSANGSLAPYTYQWQSSTDNVTFTDISGANGLEYQPGTLTSTFYYRRSVKTTSGCGPSFSNVVKITTNPILNAGVIGSPQTICFNGTGTALSFSTTPSGALGSYTFQWQSAPDSTTWSNISGQTSNTFTPTNVTAITFYRVLVFSGSCPSAGTNGVKIKLFSPITGGTIASGQTICAGTAPAAFTQVSAPSGGPGTYTFQWQSSTDSINWNNISGATSSSFTSGVINTLTYFQRLAGSTGCPSSTSNALKVKTNAKPNVVNTVSNHCFNDQMPLSNSSNISSGTLTYLWKFGDGTTSTSSVPNKTYSSSGTYNVTLIATSNTGCKDSTVKSVVVATTPLPSFTFTLKCLGDSVIFSDNTTYACGAGTGLTFLWNFGDGTTSNVQNPRHHYNPGTYNVKFKISLPGGFKDSITKTVVFNIRSTPGFSATNECFPGTTTFTNGSSNFASLLWSFGDASTSTSTSSTFTKTYSTAGTYSAKLVSTSTFGCKDSLIKTVNVFSKPKATFSVSNNCIGTTTNFNNASSGANSYAWDFGDGKTSTSVNPSNTYTSAGTFTIKLKVTSINGCLDSTTNTVTIHPKPVPDFTTANVCNGFLSSFTNTSTGASSYNWDFGNGNTSTSTNPTYTYPVAGSYTVTLTATTSNGCSASTSKSYTVNSSPKAAFTGTNVCLGLGITFNNTSTGASSNDWNFGDATTSTSANPAKTYSTAGNFNVKLVVANTFGCKDSITKTVTIFAKPIPAYTAANQCLGNAVTFTNQSTGGVSNIWVFGDGNSSATNSPTYTYATSNTYSVKLVVSSVNGCKDSISKSITVFPRPTVSFTASPSPICRGGLMTFTNTTTNGATYSWTFGNGATSSAANPTNVYNVSGNYNVKLVSVSTNGCKDSITKTVTVWPRPVASFNVLNGCTSDNLAFATNSVGAVGHEWTFGDGNTSTAANPSKGYSTAGTYSVQLIVTSINGCKDTTKSNVTIHPRASVSFTNPSNFCIGLSTTFTNTSTLSAGTMTHQWKFGDGNGSSVTSPTNTYATAGNYTVTLTTTTDKGCVNTNTSSVLIFPKPSANFNSNSVCAGGTVIFNNTTSGGSTYIWDFGDASTSTLTSPTHAYTNAGTYNVKLTATTANGCVDVFTRQVFIYANPVANFNTADRCIDQAISFTNTSTGANDVIWTFGDGNTSNSFNPSYNYNAPGTYTVILNIKSINGCLSSVTKSVTVFPAPKASFSINDNGQCINSNSFIYIDNSTVSSGTITRAWALGDGSTSTATNPTKSYTNSGNYTVRLTVTTNNGCKDSANGMVIVYAKPVANFSINNTSQCDKGHFFSFTDASTIGQGSLSRSWNMGDGTTLGGINPVKKYNSVGTYTVRLLVSSEMGCVDSTSKSVTLNPSPVASFNVNTDIQCLNGNVFNFTNTSTGSGTINSLWNLGDGSTITTSNASRTYAIDGNYKVTLNISTPAGCKDSSYFNVRILPSPISINITGSNSAPGGSVKVYSVPFNSGSTYNWTAVNGTVLSNGGNMVQVKWNATGPTGSVSVVETGANGCKGNPANYNVGLILGVNQVLSNAFAAKLYPNPSKDNFTVEVSSGDMVTMSVFDQLGREVINGKRFSSSITITNHHLASGIYTVKLTTDEGKTTILRFEAKN